MSPDGLKSYSETTRPTAADKMNMKSGKSCLILFLLGEFRKHPQTHPLLIGFPIMTVEKSHFVIKEELDDP